MFADLSRRLRMYRQACAVPLLLALLMVPGNGASACSEIPHCWFTLASVPAAPFGDWLARDLLERLEKTIGSDTRNATLRGRTGQASDLAAAILSREASTAGKESNPRKAVGGAVVEFEIRSDKGSREINGDPYCLWGPTLQCREIRTATIRYLALSSAHDVLGIDELSLKAVSTIDWSWHGFIPAGCILLRKVELVFGASPWMVSLWLGQGTPATPAAGMASYLPAIFSTPPGVIRK